MHRYEQRHEGGEIKFCFDNTISQFNSKTIFFELLQEDPDNPAEADSFSDLEGLTPEEFYEMKVQDIQDILMIVRGHLSKARQHQVIWAALTKDFVIKSRNFQDMLRSFEARDRNLAELNCSRVSLFSTIIILAMILVAFLQVYMIRNLFDTNPKGRKVWEKIEHYFK